MGKSSESNMRGTYKGPVEVRFLEDGRRVQLIKDFGYIDNVAEHWDVPADAIVDGASIPQVLWSFIGGPFEGKYRSASIIHDWFCDLRSRSWEAVHRMFYEAMITSGVSLSRAKLMYGAVYWGGPRWSKTVVDNSQLAREAYFQSSRESGIFGKPRTLHYPWPRDEFGGLGKGPYANLVTTKVETYRYPLNEADLEILEKSINQGRLELNEIESLVDSHLQSLQSTNE